MEAFKAALELEGVEAYGPKDSISSAARYTWIEDVEQWVAFLETRNAGVHDYFGTSENEYTEIARTFLLAAQKAFQRMS